MPGLGPSIGNCEDEIGLEYQRYGYEHDVKGVAEYGLSLEREEDYEGEEESGSGITVELVDEDLFEIRVALALVYEPPEPV